jgi:hypothetical protein
MRLLGNAQVGLLLGRHGNATVEGGVFDSNGAHGIAAFEGSTVSVEGEVSASDNTLAGIVVSDSSTLRGDSVATDGNQWGLFVQLGSIAELTSVQASDNLLTGLMVSDGSTVVAEAVTADGNSFGLWAQYGGIARLRLLQASDNEGFGVILLRSAVAVFGRLRVTGSPTGIWVDGSQLDVLSGTALTPRSIDHNGVGVVGIEDPVISLGGLEISENPMGGLDVEGGLTTLFHTVVDGNGDAPDVLLALGATADFQEGAVVGTLDCRGTVLVRGTPSCPPADLAELAATPARARRVPPIVPLPSVMRGPE